MAPVIVEIAPTRRTEPDEEIVIVDDLDALTEAVAPGCGDDNPYN